MALKRKNVDENDLTRGGETGSIMRDPLHRRVKVKSWTGLRERKDAGNSQDLPGISDNFHQEQSRRKKGKSSYKTSPLAKKSIVAEVTVKEVEEIQWSLKPDTGKLKKQDNPQLVEEYRMEIRKYLEQRELLPELQVSSKYLEGQTKILPAMRALLVDWMSGVVLQLCLHPETLQLAVACLDRFLQVEVGRVEKEILQLSGATALLIASKYEETYPPEVAEICHLAGGAVLESQIRDHELWILQSLGFNIGIPLPQQFLRWARYAAPGLVKKDVYCLAQYFTELSLVDYNLAATRASVRAAAASALAIRVLLGLSGQGGEESFHDATGGLPWTELLPVVKQMAQLAGVAPTNKTLLTVFRKFSGERFHCVARSPLLDSAVLTKMIFD